MKPLQVKVNTSGSWANLVTCSPLSLGKVKVACEQLASAQLGAIAFKVIDGDNAHVVAQYNSRPRPGEPHGWYAPRPE